MSNKELILNENKQAILNDLDIFLEHLEGKINNLYIYYSGLDDIFNTSFVNSYLYNLTNFIKLLTRIKDDIKNIRNQTESSTDIDLIINSKTVHLYIESSKNIIGEYSSNLYRISERLKTIKIEQFNYRIKEYLIAKVINKLNNKLYIKAVELGTNIRQLYFLTKTKNVTTIR
jgi:hypothetical protein